MSELADEQYIMKEIWEQSINPIKIRLIIKNICAKISIGW